MNEYHEADDKMTRWLLMPRMRVNLLECGRVILSEDNNDWEVTETVPGTVAETSTNESAETPVARIETVPAETVEERSAKYNYVKIMRTYEMLQYIL